MQAMKAGGITILVLTNQEAEKLEKQLDRKSSRYDTETILFNLWALLRDAGFGKEG